MESMSDVASTQAGERLNLIEFQITFSVSPTSLLLKWMQKGDMFLGLFFHNSLPIQPHLGELF